MSALGRNNTDKVSQEIQYQTAALFTTYSGGGTSVSFINWWAGRFELPALAKLYSAGRFYYCEQGGFLWLFVVRAGARALLCPSTLKLKPINFKSDLSPSSSLYLKA